MVPDTIYLFKRRFFVPWLWVWSVAILISSPAHQAAALDFSAEWIVKNEKTVVRAHVNAKDDRWRFEFAQPQGAVCVIIVRKDRNASWLILSKRRQYAEVPIAKNHLLQVSERMDGELSREYIGAELLHGHPTELFEVTVSENGDQRHYYQWITTVQRFPVKTVSKEGNWSEEFQRLMFVKQSEFLFELPLRLDPVNPPAETQR